MPLHPDKSCRHSCDRFSTKFPNVAFSGRHAVESIPQGIRVRTECTYADAKVSTRT
jgi:hypothetical protein